MEDQLRNSGRREGRPVRLVRPKHHDTYASRQKAAGAMVCETCGVVRHAGRWTWGAPPLMDLEHGQCPACRRVRDRYPAGTLRLRGDLAPHREEIENLIANVERAEKEEHPLERLMSIEADEQGLLVTTTGIHLARRITSKLERRFHAKARIRYPEEQSLMFVDLEL